MPFLRLLILPRVIRSERPEATISERFRLLTEEGHERPHRSHEAEIEALARYAWAERVVITVLTDANKPDVPVSIILRRAPPQPRRWDA